MDAQTEPESAAPRTLREAARSKDQAIELKGIVASLTALRLRTADMGLIAKQLMAKVTQMPQFFQDAPVLVDLAALGDEAARLHFSELASLLRSFKMVPVAITNANGDARARAASAGFGYVVPSVPRPSGRAMDSAKAAAEATPLPEAARGPMAEAATPRIAATMAAETPSMANAIPRHEPAAANKPARAVHRPPLVIREPVRSGQTIYAERTDLVILASVNSGAEVIADGHVHVYATLRGRAVAGARGMTDARIFCQKLDADLVAISGAYVLSDDLPAELRGKPAQIFLEDGACRVTAL